MSRLVGYWPLDENSGNAIDYSGNNNDGTVNGATQGFTGNTLLGQSVYDFDGTDDDVNVGSVLGGLTSLTISLWFNTTAASGAFFADDRTFYNRLNGSNIEFAVDGDASQVGSIVVNDGNWHHECITWVGNGDTTLYVDGVEDLSFSSGVSITPAGDNATIGNGVNENTYLNGSISEVRLYDRELSPTEIRYLYETGNQGYYESEFK